MGAEVGRGPQVVGRLPSGDGGSTPVAAGAQTDPARPAAPDTFKTKVVCRFRLVRLFWLEGSQQPQPDMCPPPPSKRAKTMKNAKTLGVIGQGIVVKPSTITTPDGSSIGNGLFADRSFKKNELITEYDGKREVIEKATVSSERGKRGGLAGDTHKYSLRDGLGTVITGIQGDPKQFVGRGAASYANDPRWGQHKSRSTRGIYNAKLETLMPNQNKYKQITNWQSPMLHSRGALKATRDIRKGEEIFVNYGTDFAQVR